MSTFSPKPTAYVAVGRCTLVDVMETQETADCLGYLIFSILTVPGSNPGIAYGIIIENNEKSVVNWF